MTPQQFIAKWQQTSLPERSACQQHFLDLCELLGQPKPAEADPEAPSNTLGRGVQKTSGAGTIASWVSALILRRDRKDGRTKRAFSG